jgi:hypothetical protein
MRNVSREFNFRDPCGGYHPDVMLISVLEYGCIVFDRMAGTHMLKLKKVQYRCLRIALGLMQSNHVQTLDFRF